MDNRSLAKKGRYGDTHIRDVYGLKSHVNKLEADIIDSYGFLGELFVKTTGSDTTNPKTGMPEYHYISREGNQSVSASHPHNKWHIDNYTANDRGFDSKYHTPEDAEKYGGGGGAGAKDDDNTVKFDMFPDDPDPEDDPLRRYGIKSLSKADFFEADGVTPKHI